LALKLRTAFSTVSIGGSEIRIRRDRNGVVHMRGTDDLDFARALGFAHGCDRMLQMMLLRIIGRGQVCELLRDDDESLAIDIFMRQMGFAANLPGDAANLSRDGRRFAEAYCAGVNHYLASYGRPWEFSLVGYRPDPWTVSDSLLTLQIMSYIGLAQGQADLERFIIQALHDGIDPDSLKILFSPHLDQLTDEVLELIRKLHLPPQRPAFRFPASVPPLSASNNWVLAPERSETGHVLQCNDPHLECNRLPPVWYEFAMETDQGLRMGVSLPGVPGLIMGRTEHISTGFTYGFMDTVDFFMEECRDGMYRREDAYHPFAHCSEVIHRKRHPSTTVVRHENELGVLETDPLQGQGIADGYHLLRAWSGRQSGAAASIDSLYKLLHCQTVAEAQAVLGEVTISCNWLIGDRQGNIGYQQSGVLPHRKHSGLHPLPAWLANNLWTGTVSSDQLARVLNPSEGFLVTANGDHNRPGKPLAVNMPMGPYREERITSLLAAKARHSPDDMKRIQTDLYSIQAERFMEHLRDHIPESPAGEILRTWNLRYDRESRGATVFEAVYRELLREAIGRPVFGAEAWDDLAEHTSILALYYNVFDRALLTAGSAWHLGAGNSAVVQRVLRRVCEGMEPIQEWGQVQNAWMDNIFFGGKLPRIFGFDHGPVPIEGSRATVLQGGVFRVHGRLTSFGPSYRYIADLGTTEIHTSLAGGSSDRRFSRWYKTGVAGWLAGGYKVLSPQTE
jgi:penicillin amidase